MNQFDSICIIYSGAALDEIKQSSLGPLWNGVSDWENAKWRWTGEASGLKAITLINIRNHRWNLKSVSCCLTIPLCTVSSSSSKQCICLAQQLDPIHRSASMGCGQVIKPDALTQGQKNGKMVDQVLEDWSLKFGGPKLPWNPEKCINSHSPWPSVQTKMMGNASTFSWFMDGNCHLRHLKWNWWVSKWRGIGCVNSGCPAGRSRFLGLVCCGKAALLQHSGIRCWLGSSTQSYQGSRIGSYKIMVAWVLAVSIYQLRDSPIGCTKGIKRVGKGRQGLWGSCAVVGTNLPTLSFSSQNVEVYVLWHQYLSTSFHVFSPFSQLFSRPTLVCSIFGKANIFKIHHCYIFSAAIAWKTATGLAT